MIASNSKSLSNERSGKLLDMWCIPATIISLFRISNCIASPASQVKISQHIATLAHSARCIEQQKAQGTLSPNIWLSQSLFVMMEESGRIKYYNVILINFLKCLNANFNTRIFERFVESVELFHSQWIWENENYVALWCSHCVSCYKF